MMDPDEYFSLFYRTAFDEPPSKFEMKLGVISGEQLNGGCVLYRLPTGGRRDMILVQHQMQHERSADVE